MTERGLDRQDQPNAVAAENDKALYRRSAGGAQVYDRPRVRSGATAYDAPPSANGAPAYEATVEIQEAPHARIRLADMRLEASPIAHAVMQAAALTAPPQSASAPFEQTIRMPALSSGRKPLTLHIAQGTRLARIRIAAVSVAALLSLLGTLYLLPIRRGHDRRGTELSPGTEASAAVTPVVSRPSGSLTTALPMTKAAADTFHQPPHLSPRVHHSVSPYNAPSRVRRMTALAGPIIEPAREPRPRPVARQTAPTPALPGPEILPAEPLADTAAALPTAPRVHRRRHRRSASLTAGVRPARTAEKTDDRPSEVEAEFARHPEPGYDEKADKWLDSLPDH